MHKRDQLAQVSGVPQCCIHQILFLTAMGDGVVSIELPFLGISTSIDQFIIC
ncbi:hypothetical protein L208DRAFT_1398319 [Tricholoma matsutake]|nr:hypothetical protein L208DRAFT_1398319 [Tricholoma matsutake 945]